MKSSSEQLCSQISKEQDKFRDTNHKSIWGKNV